MSYKSVFGLGIFRYTKPIVKKILVHILVLSIITSTFLVLGYNSADWNGIEEERDISLFEKFFNRFYFSTITFSTIGYGDISPKSNVLRLITVAFAILMLVEYYLLYKF